MELKSYLKKNKRIASLLRFPLKIRFISKIYKKLVFKRKRKLIKKSGLKLIVTLQKLFDEYSSIIFFVDFGTLLGFVREGGFINHDLDIDFGVINDTSNHSANIVGILTKIGVKHIKDYIFMGNIVEQSFIYKKIKFDICYYNQSSLNSVCYLFYTDPNSKEKYEDNKMNVVQLSYSKIEGLRKLKVKDEFINVPLNTESLLEEKYGKNWKIPDKKWIYWKAPNAKPCNELGYQVVYD